MALFRYRAVNAAGDVAAGELEAALAGRTVSAAGPALRRSRWFESRTVTRDQVLGITRELATLLRAGLPLDRALEILIGLAPTMPVAKLLQTVRDEVRGGKALS